MTRLAHPLLALFIFAGWLALAERITPGQVVLAALVALGAAWMTSRLQLERVTPRRPRVMLRLARWVGADIVRSNIAVARLIFGGAALGHSSFLTIPLDMKNRTGLAVLACIITATPGTLWVSYEGASGKLILHILDLVDESEWIDTIKNRYERLLMEIFE
jgi:multicomponent K+:H+ antiporter subunit E